jgi:hypothetical protein
MPEWPGSGGLGAVRDGNRGRKTRKLDTTDRPSVARNRSGSLLGLRPELSMGRSAMRRNSRVQSPCGACRCGPAVTRCVSLQLPCSSCTRTAIKEFIDFSVLRPLCEVLARILAIPRV